LVNILSGKSLTNGFHDFLLDLLLYFFSKLKSFCVIYCKRDPFLAYFTHMVCHWFSHTSLSKLVTKHSIDKRTLAYPCLTSHYNIQSVQILNLLGYCVYSLLCYLIYINSHVLIPP